jgi:hypothetical protein
MTDGYLRKSSTNVGSEYEANHRPAGGRAAFEREETQMRKGF